MRRPTLQVVGALASMETGPAAALEAMTAPTTTLVTLTITEKGYEDSVTTTAGTASDAPPSSAPALIALALDQRRRAGSGASGLRLARQPARQRDHPAGAGPPRQPRRIDPALAAWIAGEVRFPSSVVDRMVPAPTEAGLEGDRRRSSGCVDEAAVATERHRSWIIRSVDGLDRLADVGVELVDDVAPFERRKLWLLNGPHSAVAYGGLLAGYTTIAAAVADPVVARFVRDLVEDTLEVAALPPALQPAAFADEALRRFANPALGHTCAQVGADGSSKLPQRLLPVVAARQARSLDTTTFALVAAIWIAGVGRRRRARRARFPACRIRSPRISVPPPPGPTRSRELSRLALGAHCVRRGGRLHAGPADDEGPRVLEAER